MAEGSRKEFFASYYENERGRIEDEFKEFLRFKSISTDPAYRDHCVACASWLVDHLKAIGFSAELIPTPAKPLVYAVYDPKNSSGPTVLFYGHYDVQPVDPIEEWETAPFEPNIREGRIFARGAQDNKGQVFYYIKALEALVRSGTLKSPVRLLIEGEEEDGSQAITAVLPSIKDRIQSDILMVCDTGTLHPDCATITMGLRGLITMELKLQGPLHDLHSGVFGGVVQNPAAAMARLVASLHNPDGSIAVQGYLDDVKPISDQDRTVANAIPIPLEYLETVVGVPFCGGEESFTALERRGFRRTIEVNGIHSGYGGPGTKTIIPSYAIAKLTSRLAGGQDPKRCLAALEAHVKKHAPKGVTLEIPAKGIGGAALLLSSTSSLVQKAKSVLDQIAPKGTVMMWEGASIPIIPALAEASGGEPLLVGFGLEEDKIHAPNESFSLEQFKRGFLYVSLFLEGAGGGS